MHKQGLRDFSGKFKEKINRVIAEVIEKRSSEVIEVSPHLAQIAEAMQELGKGGKRLRGLLTILGYQISLQHTANSIQQESEIIKAAAVMELFHLGLLIQDDVMDRDELRRGVKTIHHGYEDLHLGESIAVCAGDLTFGWGMEIIAGLKLPKDNVNKAIAVWGKYFARVGYGQILDVLGEQRGDTSEDEVLQVLQLKSGEYTCVLPLLLGATLAGGSEEVKERLEKYGMELGWVFQLRDDWLAEYGDSQKTGKPVGNDRREGRRSFATIYGKANTEEAIREHLELGTKLARDLQGQALKAGIMEDLLAWMATREN